MISDNARSGMQQAPARSLFNALGFTAEELKKPMVGIVSSYNEIVPGHMNIDKIVNAVKLALRKQVAYRLYFRQSRSGKCLHGSIPTCWSARSCSSEPGRRDRDGRAS